MISHISAVDESINEVILLIGLAVGVDYSMFYLRREREERESGRSESAVAGGRRRDLGPRRARLRVHGDDRDGGHVPGRGADVPVLRHRHDPGRGGGRGRLAHRAAALLAWLGDRVEKGRVPFLDDGDGTSSENSAWSRILNPALRHPVVSVVAAGALLVVLAIPAFSLHTASPGVETLPQDLGVIKTYNGIQAAFPGGPIPAVGGGARADNVKSPPVIAGDQRADARGPPPARISSSRSPSPPAPTTPSPRSTSRWSATAPTPDRRHSGEPARQADPGDDRKGPRGDRRRTGYTANSTDFNDTMKSHAPVVFVFVLLGGLHPPAVHLPLARDPAQGDRPQPALGRRGLRRDGLDLPGGPPASRSSASSRTARSSRGCRCSCSWCSSASRWTTTCSSSRESARPTTGARRPTDAVSHGIKTTAGVVTSAAVVMISVFAIFATLSLLIFKELGVGPRGRGPDRRDRHPRRAAARDDEAARRLELVPAEVARVAAARRPRRRHAGPGRRADRGHGGRE